MCLLGKYDSHRSYEMEKYVSSYLITLEKDELTALIQHFERSSKPRIPIYNSKVPDTTSKKMKRRKTQEIAKRYVFNENAAKIYDGFK